MRRPKPPKLPPPCNPIGRCPVTNKLQYESEAEAGKDAKRIRKRGHGKLKPYSCHFCEHWHNGHWRPPHRRKVQPWMAPTRKSKPAARNNQSGKPKGRRQ